MKSCPGSSRTNHGVRSERPDRRPSCLKPIGRSPRFRLRRSPAEDDRPSLVGLAVVIAGSTHDHIVIPVAVDIRRSAH